MLKKKQSIEATKQRNIETPSTKQQEQFSSRVVRLNALACSFRMGEDDDMTNAETESMISLKALNTEGGLQEMLAAQMVSLHQLQQISNAMAAKNIADNRYGQYFVNTSVKLANTFVQQASLLSKLQVSGRQRIVVERVDVRSGGQAIVGNINNSSPKI